MFNKLAISFTLASMAHSLTADEMSYMRFSGKATNRFNGNTVTDWPNRIHVDVIMQSVGVDDTEGRAWGPLASGAEDADIEELLHVQARCWAMVDNNLFIGGHAVQIPKALAHEGVSPGNRRQLQNNGCDKSRNTGQGQNNAANPAFGGQSCIGLFAACCVVEPCRTEVNLFTPAAGGPNSDCDDPPCAGGGNPFNRDLVEAKEDDCLITDNCLPGKQVIYVFSNIGKDGESASDLFLKDFDFKECTGFGELAASLELTNLDAHVTESFAHESFEVEL